MKCVCGARIVGLRLSDDAVAGACDLCDQWFIVTRRSTLRRLTEFLSKTVSRYSHPDDRVFVPFAPF
jgi:hypothetical protein